MSNDNGAVKLRAIHIRKKSPIKSSSQWVEIVHLGVEKTSTVLLVFQSLTQGTGITFPVLVRTEHLKRALAELTKPDNVEGRDITIPVFSKMDGHLVLSPVDQLIFTRTTSYSDKSDIILMTAKNNGAVVIVASLIVFEDALIAAVDKALEEVKA